MERSAEDTGLVITTYEGTHTHVSPATGSRGASDAPLLPAAGEHPPGGAPYQAPPKDSKDASTAAISRVKYELPAAAKNSKDMATISTAMDGPLRPTPSIPPIDPTRLLPGKNAATTRAEISQQSSMMLAQQLLADEPQAKETVTVTVIAPASASAVAAAQVDKSRSEHLMKDLQDALCWGSVPSISHAAAGVVVASDQIMAAAPGETNSLLSTPSSSSSPSPGGLSEGLLEDIVRHRH